jgi:transketolase
MSEHISNNHELGQEDLQGHNHEVEKNKPELEVDLKSVEAAQTEKLETARSEVESESDNKNELVDKLSEQHIENDDSYKAPVNKELKSITLNRELKHIRNTLSKPDKIASRIIHQPAIRVVSESSSKTITRPSGLLGGGVTAFIGSALYYYFTKHIGVRYNYFIFILLFVVGFGLGLCVELTIWAMRSRKSIPR